MRLGVLVNLLPSVVLTCARAGWVSMVLSESLRKQRSHPAQELTDAASAVAGLDVRHSA